MSIYFLNQGVVGNVLTRYQNVKFVDYPEGAEFGVIDIISSCFKNEIDLSNWIGNLDKM